MKNLSNLMRMDWAKLRTLERTMLFAILIGGLFMLDAGTTFVGFILLLYMWVYSPLAYDEINKGEQLTCTLPVTRREIVLAKYIYGLLGVALATMVWQLVQLVRYLLGDLAAKVGMVDKGVAIPVGMLLAIGLVFVSIVLPLVLWLGVTKARYWVMACYIGGIALLSVYYTLVREEVLSAPENELFYAALGVAVLAVSFLVSRRLFERREFT